MAENYITRHVEKGTVNISEDVIAVMVSAAIDVIVNVKLGGSITDIAVQVQEAVCREVESVTGMSAVVNVHVTGVSFDK